MEDCSLGNNGVIYYTVHVWFNYDACVMNEVKWSEKKLILKMNQGKKTEKGMNTDRNYFGNWAWRPDQMKHIQPQPSGKKKIILFVHFSFQKLYHLCLFVGFLVGQISYSQHLSIYEILWFTSRSCDQQKQELNLAY